MHRLAWTGAHFPNLWGSGAEDIGKKSGKEDTCGVVRGHALQMVQSFFTCHASKNAAESESFPESLFWTGYPRKAAESSLRQVNPTRFGNLLVLQFLHLNRFIRFTMADDIRLP